MTERGLSVGLLVKHEKWGLGKVIHLDPQDVWVYFKDVEGTPKVAVKQLNQRVAVLTTAAKQSDSALDNLPPMVRDGRLELPDTLRITEQQAEDMFVEQYRDFDDPEYRKHERDYKWEAHRQVAADPERPWPTHRRGGAAGRSREHVKEADPPDEPAGNSGAHGSERRL